MLIEKDEDGRYVANCPPLPGCVADGATRAEAIENIKDVIRLCLADLRELGQPIPQTESVQIAV
ncbi:MAG: type II toxin-antitoxin system HicB family antitoxin [Actinomycetota bacterium]